MRVAWLVAIVPLVACARGNDATPRDECNLRDCGPTFGGSPDPLDEGIGPIDPGRGDDTGAPDQDNDASIPPDDAALDAAPDDTSFPPLDSSPAADSSPSADSSSPVDSTPPPVDAGCNAPSGSACTTVPQCGCASGQNCDVTTVSGAMACVAAGAAALNASCSDLGQCARGLTCVGGVCVPFCKGAGDCAGPTGIPVDCHAVEYVPSGSTTPQPIPNLDVCMVQCDPRAPSAGCGAGVGCDFADTKTTLCVSAGTATGAHGCDDDVSACAPGFTCVGVSSTENDCVKWCRVAKGAADCPSGETCNEFQDPPQYRGTTEYGFCY